MGHYERALELLYMAAKRLLEARQWASGNDLALYMVHVYDLMKHPPDTSSKKRILDLLRLYDPQEPTRKRLIRDALGWSSRYTNVLGGDPDLHHGVGLIWAQEGNLFEAEKHLVLGTQQSFQPFMSLLCDYFDHDTLDMAPFYVSRAIFPYLMLHNLSAASLAYHNMVQRLEMRKASMQKFSSSVADIVIFPAFPLMNFLGFLILTCQRGIAELYNTLKAHYTEALKQAPAWEPSLDKIAEIYFHIGITAQTTPWADWMRQWLGTEPANPTQLIEPAPCDAVD